MDTEIDEALTRFEAMAGSLLGRSEAMFEQASTMVARVEAISVLATAEYEVRVTTGVESPGPGWEPFAAQVGEGSIARDSLRPASKSKVYLQGPVTVTWRRRVK